MIRARNDITNARALIRDRASKARRLARWAASVGAEAVAHSALLRRGAITREGLTPAEIDAVQELWLAEWLHKQKRRVPHGLGRSRQLAPEPRDTFRDRFVEIDDADDGCGPVPLHPERPA